MLRIGLTGGIGAGKSAVGRRLEELGAQRVDADEVARQVVAPGTPGLDAVCRRFGAGVLRSDGSLDRAALARVAFADAAARRDLEAITHPLVAARTAELVAPMPADAVLVHEVPLLVELDMMARYHLVIVVEAPLDVRLTRLVERGMTRDDAVSRIAAQVPEDVRRAAADVVLENTGSLAELYEQVDELWRARLAPWRDNLASGTRVRRALTAQLVAPDPAWPSVAVRQVRRVRHALVAGGYGDELMGVDHIGSTAVPGLAAKPVVDLQVRLRDLGTAREPAFHRAMASAGLLPREQPEGESGTSYREGYDDDVHPWICPDPAAWQKLFFTGTDPAVVYHVHVRAHTSPGARVALQLRDWLRRNPAEAAAYEQVKRAAVLSSPGGTAETKGDYCATKAPWIRDALHRAEEWAQAVGWAAPRAVPRPLGSRTSESQADDDR